MDNQKKDQSTDLGSHKAEQVSAPASRGVAPGVLSDDLVNQIEAWLHGPGVKYACARGYGFEYQADCPGCLLISSVRQLKSLREALRGLIDEQNDAPLETRRAQWQAAIDRARELVGDANG